jgi:hypothetical protein
MVPIAGELYTHVRLAQLLQLQDESKKGRENERKTAFKDEKM